VNRNERRRQAKSDQERLHGIQPTMQATQGEPGNWQFPTGPGQTTDRAQLQAIAESTTVTARPELPGAAALGVLGGDSNTPPVMLLEPAHALMIGSTDSGAAAELQVGVIHKRGFALMNQAVTQITTLDGWALHTTTEGVRLADEHNGEWAFGEVSLPVEWCRLADEYGWVMTLYGVGLGTRPNEDGTPLPTSQRQQMLTKARRSGFVAAAIVGWHG